MCHKKCKFVDFVYCLRATQHENKINQYKNKKKNKFLEKIIKISNNHYLYTVEVNKISLSANDDKRVQLINSIETYARETIK